MKTADKPANVPSPKSSLDDNTALLEELKAFEISAGQTAEEPAAAGENVDTNLREAAYDNSEAFAKAVPFKNAVAFYATGKLPAVAGEWQLPQQLTPALLFAVRDLSQIRHDYPLCLLNDSAKQVAKPLRDIFDALLAAQAVQGDDAERLKRELFRVEAEIKKIVAANKEIELSTAFDTALQIVQKDNHKPKTTSEAIAKHLKAISQALPANARLLPFSAESQQQLLQETAKRFWQKQSRAMADEAESLCGTLQDILAADQHAGNDTQNEERLQASLGKTGEEELDFGTLSAMINDSRVRETLPEARRLRIQQAVETLISASTSFFDPAVTPAVAYSCDEALAKANANFDNWVDFCKQLHIARLEAANQFNDEKHPALFTTFGAAFLSQSETELVPPVLLHLSAGTISDADKLKLPEILAGDHAIKVLFIVENTQLANAPFSPDYATLATAKMAVQLNSAFVFQSPAANVAAVLNGFESGTKYPGIALFSIFAPTETAEQLPAYLRSAAAAEARIFPVFRFNPALGDSWREKFEISETPQNENRWAVSAISYRDASDKSQSTELPFTATDFMLMDSQNDAQLLPVPPGVWAENLLPLDEFLSGKSTDKLPYLQMVDENSQLWRVIPSAKLVEIARKFANNWRLLQEFGGIENSHAKHLLAQEKAAVRAEFEQQIADLKAAHEAEISKNTDELSRDIISRIAAGMLSEGMGNAIPAMPVQKPAAASKPKTEAPAASAEAKAEPAQPDEEEEALSFDEPYIDSPLCTSCNDCINKNSLIFAYDANKQAYIKDASAGSFRELVEAAENCPVKIIHPGKPKNPNEPNLDALVQRAAKFN
ncbi:MAG: ferredoxin [Calditrichia bacterium]